jgi:ATP-dependent DNA helicase RecQ
VPDFAKRLARRLGIPFIEAIDKVRNNEPQKLQLNRYHQCRNLDGVFKVRCKVPPAAVFLVDDIVDSGWTMAVLSALLRQAGSDKVFPVALASTRPGD